MTSNTYDETKTKTKTISPHKAIQVNIYSGYTYQYGLQREIMCMKLLYNTYCRVGCICGRNAPHFPVMLANETKHGGYIKMTHQGVDLKNVKRKKYMMIESMGDLKILNSLLDPESMSRQIDCILNLLSKANITHLDLNDNGKNICINEDGHLSIIDFDIMHFKSLDTKKTITPEMNKRIARFKNVDFKKKIYNIILGTIT